VRYDRWGWGDLEPQPGQLNTELLDKVLKETHDAGQTLAFRVMCCASSQSIPLPSEMAYASRGKELLVDHHGHGPYVVPDMDNPVFIQRHLDFIKRLAARYDGHRDIAHIDLGSIGWWGEWHMSASTKGRCRRRRTA